MFVKNNKTENNSLVKKILYDLSVIIISVGVLYFAAIVYAGDLIPPGPIGLTMKSLGDIYDVLAGTYDSSAVAPNNNGNVMQILKCITEKMNGNPC